MLSLALSTIFLISLVSASEERTAAVLSASTSHSLALTSRGVKVFNAKAALAEKDQIAAQYSSKRAPHEDRKKNDRMGHPSQHKHFEEEYDIRKKCKPHHGPHGDKMCSHGKGGHHKRSFGESSGKEDSGAEPMVDVFDTADELYYGNLAIGTPAQTTTVQFDTGSSDLVIALTTCKNCTAPLFDTTKSTTYKPSTKIFNISYEDTSGAQGVVANDTVTVASLTIDNQGFGAIDNVTNGFGDGPNAGLIGLGYPANAESDALPFFFNLVQQKKLRSNIFSMYMARGGKNGSEVCIGCIDSSKFTGDIDYYPLNPKATNNTQYYWNVQSGGFVYGNGTSTGALEAVIDSGTTLVYVQAAEAKALYAQIPNSAPAPKTANLTDGYYTFPCNTTLAPISLLFGSKSYVMDADDFNQGQLTPGSPLCVGGIVGQDTKDKLSVIGDEWMKNWYSVFDYPNSRVGFARAI